MDETSLLLGEGWAYVADCVSLWVCICDYLQ